MSNIKEIIHKYDLSSSNYRYIKNARILDTNHGKYVIKKRGKENKSQMYEYLKVRGFHSFLPSQTEEDEYEIYPFIEEVSIPNEQKAIDLMYIMSLLHNKTTFYREISLDNVKEMYEELDEKIKHLMQYYNELQNMIEIKIYFSPSEYLLIRNISEVYYMLQFALDELNTWYEEKTKQKKERVVLLHNNIQIDHILVSEEENLISWDKASYGIPIYDFLQFYKKEYLNLEMDSLFDIYQSKFAYTPEEKHLFFCLLAIPEKVSITKENYKNTYEIMRFVKYIKLTRDFILKEQEKQPKPNQ